MIGATEPIGLKAHMLGLLKQQPTGDTVVVGVGLALVADVFSEVNVLLVVLCAIAMATDVASGIVRTIAIEGLEGIGGGDFSRGIAKKLAIVFFWVAAALLDGALGLVPEAGTAIQGLTPVFKTVLMATLFYEVGSITRNTIKATGRNGIGSIILRVAERGSEVRPNVHVADGAEGAVVAIEDDGEEECP